VQSEHRVDGSNLCFSVGPLTAAVSQKTRSLIRLIAARWGVPTEWRFSKGCAKHRYSN
jgi:hypothetical protein